MRVGQGRPAVRASPPCWLVECVPCTVRLRTARFLFMTKAMARPNLGKLLAAQARRQNARVAESLASVPARTRFAPSPTGFMHLGSLRTCLYNYLLARATNGQFLLRIEDTDRKRRVPGAEDNILETLKWAGLAIDEGPYFQSQRQPIYAAEAAALLERGLAYRCFCSQERLQRLAESARQLNTSTASYDRKCSHITPHESTRRAQSEPFVVRFKMDSYPAFRDVIRGEVRQAIHAHAADVRFDDFVILKSDGMPTYHFANVIDDSLMHITHVVRGEEWLASTPRHVALYAALGKSPPAFVHLPLLAAKDGHKLSKRERSADALALGRAPHFYEPEAVLNFVALQGWSPPRGVNDAGVSEMLSLAEMEKVFSLNGLTKGLVRLDYAKLEHLNKLHFRALQQTDPVRIVRECHAALPELSQAETSRAVGVLRKHLSSVADYVRCMQTILAPPATRGAPAPKFAPVQTRALELAASTSDSDFVAQLVKEFGTTAQQFLRYALLGGQSGVGVFEAVQILGMEEVRARICRSPDAVCVPSA